MDGLTAEEIIETWGHEETEPAPEEELEDDLEDQEDEDIEEPEDGEPEDEPDGDDDDGGTDGDQEQEDPFREERERLEEQGRLAQTAALDAQAASLNLKDPYTGKIITTHAELLDFQQKSREEKLNQVAKAAGLSKEELTALIDQHPDVTAGRQLKAQMEAQARAQAQANTERALLADVAEIGKLMPEVNSKEAVVSHESWPRVRELMRKNPNLGLKDAWTLANIGTIQGNAGKRAQTAARQKAQSKNHLKGAASRGTGSVEVPPEVKAVYRSWYPNMTEAEMRRAYAAEMKNK